ncbi:DUF3800 domain-containing protein [Thiomicrorhabdus sp.]|uniref:DUF3800 domain-containing protein n=1 Tax=Thiomicrorhabdus sp. TaxID=2039724 RepID=UPI003565A86C
MEILIDEAGSFAVKNAPQNSWCVVAAYACPETEKRKYRETLRNLKIREGVLVAEELKLHQISELNYIKFLRELGALEGVLFCIATDSHLNKLELVMNHQKTRATSMLENVDEMKYESGRNAVRYMTSQLEELPAQLYVQLSCQIQLMHTFVNRGISYFVQRKPNSLKSFKWKIDQKEPQKKTDFEDVFEKFSPTLLQTLSLQNPGHALNWCDYRPMSEFMYKKGEIPEYLIDKFPHLKEKEGFDIQKIIRKNIKFIDSKSYEGIQVADLLASGMRRLLRQEFDNNYLVAKLFGELMVQEVKNQPPIKLVTFGEEASVNEELAQLVRLFSKHCRPMINKN